MTEVKIKPVVIGESRYRLVMAWLAISAVALLLMPVWSDGEHGSGGELFLVQLFTMAIVAGLAYLAWNARRISAPATFEIKAGRVSIAAPTWIAGAGALPIRKYTFPLSAVAKVERREEVFWGLLGATVYAVYIVHLTDKRRIVLAAHPDIEALGFDRERYGEKRTSYKFEWGDAARLLARRTTMEIFDGGAFWGGHRLVEWFRRSKHGDYSKPMTKSAFKRHQALFKGALYIGGFFLAVGAVVEIISWIQTIF